MKPLSSFKDRFADDNSPCLPGAGESGHVVYVLPLVYCGCQLGMESNMPVVQEWQDVCVTCKMGRVSVSWSASGGCWVHFWSSVTDAIRFHGFPRTKSCASRRSRPKRDLRMADFGERLLGVE